MNIDFSSWEEFVFDELFEIRKGFYNKKPEHIDEGYIPFLGATAKNNGITEYYTLDEIKNSTKTGTGINADLSEKLFPPNALCITNNGSVGNAYFQEKEFTCSHDVNPLYRLDGEFNRYTALFVATVIQQDKYRWAYGRKWRPERMKKSKLKLPAINGKPDWEFMEKYIKSLHHKELTTKNQKSKLSLNINEWSEFRLGDLFDEIYKSKSYVESEMDIVNVRKDSYIPFISRTDENNGCKCYVPDDDLEGIEEGNAIIIGDTTATIFYQKEDFITGDHIIVCRANWINVYTALFIKTILEKERYRYGYGRAFILDLVKNTVIKLPCKNNTPDWVFMENYIRQLPYADNLLKVF